MAADSSQAESTNQKRLVFISYRRSDQKYAAHLYQLLRHRNVDVWYDFLIKPGEEWRDKIADYLSRSSLMIIFLSKDAISSPELKKELSLASSKKIPPLTVRLDDTELHGAFAYELSGGNWFDLTSDQSNRMHILADIVSSMINRPETISEILSSSIKAQKLRDWSLLLRVIPILASAIHLSLSYVLIINWGPTVARSFFPGLSLSVSSVYDMRIFAFIIGFYNLVLVAILLKISLSKQLVASSSNFYLAFLF